MDTTDFNRSVFINCPFDTDFAPPLQAILFCVVDLGFQPRIASESSDSAANRLEKICSLIHESRYSIHDLSRCQAANAGDYFRLNMPFELGLDYGARRYGPPTLASKFILVLEEKPFRYQAAISDLAGCDIRSHAGDYLKVIRAVRNWLVDQAGAKADGAARIAARYADFQQYYYERQLAAGFSEDDIQDYPTTELLGAMQSWVVTERKA